MNQKEYNNCVEAYADRIFRFVVKQIGHEADAHDVVQHAFEVLWRKRGEIIYGKAKSFLFTVARNHMIDNIRKMKRIDNVEFVPENAQHAEARNFELKEALDLGLQQLNGIQRSMILLRDYEGYSYKEIAQITELSEAQVKINIFRGRKKLQKFLISVEKMI